MMCDRDHNDRIKRYGYCSLCNTKKLDKIDNKNNERKPERK